MAHLLSAVVLAATLASAADYTLAQIKSYPFPNELAAAPTGSRIAWAFNERGIRNLYVAEGPDWRARQLTQYTRDDGQELTQVSLSPNGSHVVYVRGGDHGSNFDAALPVNPIGDPTPLRVQIWSIPFAGGEAKSLGEGENPVISPKGDQVAFERERQIWIVPIDASSPAKRLFTARGDNTDPQWSPDGARIAFQSARGDHSFIGVFTSSDMPIQWLAPTAARDSSPRWSPDSKRIAFMRRPAAGGPPISTLEAQPQEWWLYAADIATGKAQELWQSPLTLRGSPPTTQGGVNLHWAALGRIAFLSYMDGWPHLYSIPENGGQALLLTPGNYMAEYITLSPDRKTLLFTANAGDTKDDIDRRHIVRVPVDKATPEVLTPGAGLEWTPVPTSDGKQIACISAGAKDPPLPTIISGANIQRLATDRIPKDFPTAKLITPKAVTYKSSDGLEIHAQLFDAGGPGKRPAIVYVHGGPPRQMLLGWNYSDYYANAYALNQYLASRGYIVIAINYRLGIGYGFEFHRPPQAGIQGAAEYRDVQAAGNYLRSLPNVDEKKIGIYGGSYGGYLTALALARDSGIFAAGVDIHGVHDFTSDGGSRFGQNAWRFEKTDRDRAAEIAWASSPVSSLATWTSPVLLIHADDDRNVRFSQTADLVRRLAQTEVEHEVIVVPDDTHHWMRFANQMLVNEATAGFFDRKLK
ncbi:S9 family peptidase [Bryobacter aggregatus]|uniref:S9 family peptidase n=1 Tax=Bryobacter aggregatus TaxID=360054 RepID=UPI0004E1079C|nr:prolyl oligopeptidase family serine peptidase [Bryobacter aggregatus]